MRPSKYLAEGASLKGRAAMGCEVLLAPRAIEGLDDVGKLECARKQVHDHIDAAFRGTDSNSDARPALGFCVETRQIVCCQMHVSLGRAAPLRPGKLRYASVDSNLHQMLF